MLHPTLHQHSTECYAQLLRCLFYSVSQSDQREYTGAKVAHKMLYKLTPLVNFINILRAAFETKILWQNLQSQINIIREKLRKRLSFKKESSNMLVKLTTSFNFINILHAIFLPISFCHALSLKAECFSFVIFCAKIFAKNVRVKRWWNWHLVQFHVLVEPVQLQSSLDDLIIDTKHFTDLGKLNLILVVWF